jgi:tetratricopeptide (TPR) repeat protein
VTLAALLSSHLRFATERFWLTIGWPLKVVGTLVCVAGCAYLLTQTWRDANEKRWLAKASRAPIFSAAQIGFLEKAYGWDPRNFETTTAIGEAYWTQSKDGGEDWRELAQKGMEWFGRSMKLNPVDGKSFLRYGMCLDWIERVGESEPYFQKAEELDPNSYFIVANIGLHYVQMENYAAAKPWFERSLRLQWRDNPTAVSYLAIARRKLLENATSGVGSKRSVISGK